MLKKAFPALVFMLLPALAAGASISGSASSGKNTIGITNSAAHKSNSKKLPIIDGQEALASVAGDPITVDEFNRVLRQLHNSVADEKKKDEQLGKKDKDQAPQRIDYAGVLDRIINISLADHEAINIGLGQNPKLKKQMENYSDDVLVGMIKPNNMNDVKPDPAVESSIYKGLVKEYRIESAVFNIKTFAEEARKDILTQKERDEHQVAVNLLNSWAHNVRPGEDFDKVVRAAIKKGVAVGNLKGVYVKPSKMPPAVAAIVSRMKVGQTSPLLRGGINEFVILKLIGVRYPEGDRNAMEQARQQALKLARTIRLNEFVSKLEEKYITTHEDVIRKLDKIDYTAKGFDIYKMEKDKRILADVKGGKPVTVGELAGAIDKKFYHGLNTVHNSEVLQTKNFLLRAMLARRAFKCEALAEGLQNSKVYKSTVDDYHKILLFGIFMSRVIVPEVKVQPGDAMAYYKTHITDFAEDEMMRVKALAFTKKQKAQNAFYKLKKGDDFNWVKANAPGQASSDAKGRIDFGDSLVYITDFPPDAQNALQKAKTGDARLYEGPEVKGAKKLFYVLYVKKEVPSTPKPFDEVKGVIQQKVFGEKLMEAANNWFAKLRKAYNVQIYDDSLKVNHLDDAPKNKINQKP